MIHINNLSYTIENREILEKVNLVVNKGEKIGLVGVNGAGKSTLLKIIAGILEPIEGDIQKKNVKISYLEQEVKRSIDELSQTISKSETNLSIEEYLVLKKGLDIEPWEIAKYLNNMNVADKGPEDSFMNLSGGQKIKVEIIATLNSNPDLLILDEPTNFLDIPTSEWLMKYLCDFRNSVLVVSHDLRLMNRSINRIWYLNEITHKVESFNGNYDKFLIFKERQSEWLVKALKNEEKRVKKMIITAQTLSGRKSSNEKVRAAKLLNKALEKKKDIEEEKVKINTKSKKMRLRFEIDQVSSKKVITARGVSKRYGKLNVLNSVNIDIERGDRVIVVGRNGIGKTTLLKILSGNLKQDGGSIEYGSNLKIGYYAQEYDGLDYSKSIIDNFLEDDNARKLGRYRILQILSGFLFQESRIDQKVETLSGGEKTRLALAKLIVKNNNLLLLDEPTTYLDPKSQDILLDSLKEFKGTMVLVSHVPDFVKGVNPDKVLLLPEERYTFYEDRYLNRVREE